MGRTAFAGRLPAGPFLSLAANSACALYHGALGALHRSVWFSAMCAFYLLLAAARFGVVVCGAQRGRAQRFVQAAAGGMLAGLSAVVAWLNTLSLSQDIAAVYGTITMISVAAFTTGKVSAAAVCAVRQRRKGPPFAALNGIRCAEAAASVLTLQRSMLVSFGAMPPETRRMMNALTGAGVCLFVLLAGVCLILKTGKEDVLWQNPNSQRQMKRSQKM